MFKLWNKTIKILLAWSQNGDLEIDRFFFLSSERAVLFDSLHNTGSHWAKYVVFDQNMISQMMSKPNNCKVPRPKSHCYVITDAYVIHY